MIYPNSVIILNILHRDYPDVAGRIAEQISNALPKKTITDYSCLPAIVDQFKAATGITAIKWQQQKERVACLLSGDDHRLCKVTEVREMLVAVVLMFYNPERLMGFSVTAKPSLIKALAEVLDCQRVVVSQSLANAITAYKAYRTFKAEVDQVYEHIKVKGEYFL